MSRVATAPTMLRPLVRGRHAGVFIPLFSMPSTRSWGIGELPDVVWMADWLRAAGLDLLQLLPLGEMASGQWSPYNALSAMALDPIFIGLAELEEFEGLGGEEALGPAEHAELARLRGIPSVDYQAVRRLKAPALRAAYRRFRDTEWRGRSRRRHDLERYCEAQAWWLDDYALFRALHATYSELPWTSWSEELRSRDATALARAREALAEEILFVQYLQWILDTQWRRARERASQVAMVGDVSFTVSWDSADVWAHQDCFDLTATVGAPPDAFNPAGQDWGLPAYRWETLRALDYGWLRQRARRTAELYDACRIDHIVGFYRTYVRPSDGRPPYFAPAEVPEQLALGEDVLRIFIDTGIRVLAEDLGTVPDFVRASLVRHGVPGYRVLRWERTWETEGQPYVDPASYPAASVATSGTHDVESLADWWDARSVEERRQVCRIPALRDVPERLVRSDYGAEIRDALLRALFASGSDLVILPVQDVFGWHGQINRPGVPSDENWTYRLPWPSDRLGIEPEALERACVLRGWSEGSGRAQISRGCPMPEHSGSPRRAPGEARVVLFDLYGTLVDIVLDETSPAFWEGLAAWLESWRAGVGPRQLQLRYVDLCRAEEARRGPRHLLDTVFRRLLRDLGRPSSRRDIVRFGELFRSSSTRMFRVKPYAVSVLGAIRRSGCRIGLVSNTEAVLTRFDLRRSGLVGYFDAILLSSEVGLRKPDPRVFTRALRRLRAAAGRAVFVGNDIEADIAGAQKAGLRAVFVNPEGPGFGAAGLSTRPEVIGALPTASSILGGLERLGWKSPSAGCVS